MYGIFVISIPLLTATKENYRKKHSEWVDKRLNAMQSKDIETRKMLENEFRKLNPHCFPYNATVGYVEIWIDRHDILLGYFFNGDNRKIYNRGKGHGRKITGKIYNPLGHQHGSSFSEKNNKSIILAMMKTIDTIKDDVHNYKLTINEKYYRKLLTSLDFVGFLNSDS